MRRVVGLSLILVLLVATAQADPAAFHGLDVGCSWPGLSPDGSIVVGQVDYWRNQAFRWTAAQGLVRLGNVPSGATAVSGNGMVVGWSGEGGDARAYLWTPQGALRNLGALASIPGFTYEHSATANGISADGTVVVGRDVSVKYDPPPWDPPWEPPDSMDFQYQYRAFRWTANDGRMIELEQGAEAISVSADGNVIVGDGTTGQAFRWTETRGTESLGVLDAGCPVSLAEDVSADGSVIVGCSYVNRPGTSSYIPTGFRWTPDRHMVPLDIVAQAVSGDGSVIVGKPFTDDARLSSLCIWDEENGTREIADLLAAHGASVSGWTLTGGAAWFEDISADGRTIVGIGIDPPGRQDTFRAVLPEYAWTGGTGNFNNRFKWPIQIVPGKYAAAIFSQSPGTDVVQFTEDTSTNQVIVRNSDVTFQLNGHTYTAGSAGPLAGLLTGTTGQASVIVGDAAAPGAKLTIASGTLIAANGVQIHPGSTLALATAEGAFPLEQANIETDHLIIEKPGSDVGRLEGSGKISAMNDLGKTNVLNQGIVSPGQPYSLTSTGSLWFPREIEAQLQVKGDFVQTSTGSLSVTLDRNKNKITPGNYLPPAFPLVVDGQASLDGTLVINRADNFIPDVGDRYYVMSYGNLEGRFRKLSGAIDDDKFFGLLYKENELQAITLETPRRLGGGTRLTSNGQPANQRDNLILVTHGWKDDADGWVTTLALQMAVKATEAGHGTWDVLTVDWRNYAAGTEDHFNWSPWAAAANAIDIGESIGLWLDDRGFADHDNIHVLGHSAGSWLVDSLADYLKRTGSPAKVHVTLFDAFVPSNGPEFAGARTDEGEKVALGDSATWAEQFVDAHFLPYTSVTLPDAFNVDVTQLYTGPGLPFGFEGHGWPIEWYLETVLSPTDPENNKYGFFLSAEYAGYLHSHESDGWHRGLRVKLEPASHPDLIEGMDWVELALSEEQSVVSDTGTATFTPDGLVLETGSPVMVTSFVELAEPASLLSFDFEFLSDADGLLSVYFQGQEITEIEESLIPEGLGLLNSGDLWLGQEFDPGTYSLLFRLDPLDDRQSVVRISNVQFGSFVLAAVPEPASLVLLGVGAAILLLGARFRRLGRRPA